MTRAIVFMSGAKPGPSKSCLFSIGAKTWTLAFLVAVFLEPARALPACAGPVSSERAQVVRIDKSGTLVLLSGREARLEGIRLPAGQAEDAPQSFMNEALAYLSSHAVGHVLTLASVPPAEDRYGRLRVQAFDREIWLQRELLLKGLAQVNISSDRVDCAAELYEAERGARSARAGLWSAASHRVQSANDVSANTRTFQLVEGNVTAVTVRGGQAWLDFWPSGFAALIRHDDLHTFREWGVDPRGYEGKTILVRGFLEKGPTIAIANPAQVEVVAP